MRECEICHVKKDLKSNFRRHGAGFSCLCRKCERDEKIDFRVAYLMDDNNPFEFIVGEKMTHRNAERIAQDANERAKTTIALVVPSKTESKLRE